MKKITLIISMITLCVGFSSTVSAQASATATADATIVTPISIVKDVNMNFGNLAVTSTGGTVVMEPSAAATRDVSGGGVTLPTTTGTVTAAQFTVSGDSGFTYTIMLPTTASSLTSGVNTMSLDNFTSSIATTVGAGSLATGPESFYVGATLHVAASQPAGSYTTATPFSVTVNYN